MSSVLITGVAGFIASHLSERLLDRGDTVVGIDNFDPFYDRAIKERNLTGQRKQGGFTFIEADIRDAGKMDAIFAEHKPEIVVHIAALAGVRPSIERPGDYMSVNVDGTTNMLNAAAKNGSPKFVFASSSSVYGNNKKVPFSEDDRVDNPISPYAASKKACELICHSFHHLYDMPMTCLRFFTVYGPRNRPDLAAYKFTDRIHHGLPIKQFGDGTTRRDYTFIEDILAGIMAAIDRCEGYHIYNLGNSKPVLLTDMIAIIADAVGKKPVIEMVGMQPGDVEITYADISKAQADLGYDPKTEFDDGIPKLVEWYHSLVD